MLVMRSMSYAEPSHARRSISWFTCSLSPAWGASAEWDCFGQQKKYNPNNMYHRRHLSIS